MSPPSQRWIYLIRHGETPENASRVVQTPEAALSPRGLEQAERLAQRLGEHEIARIVASDLARAAMTAQRLHAVNGAPLEFDPLLQERNFGDVRGTPYHALGVDLFAPDYAPPGGESWQTFHLRVDRAWRRIGDLAASAEGNLAVVTHGLVCHSLMRHLALPEDAQPDLGFGNTSLTIIAAEPPHTVHLFNCTSHLDPGSRRDGARV
jgi:probable phosphoglycerate mutase